MIYGTTMSAGGPRWISGRRRRSSRRSRTACLYAAAHHDKDKSSPRQSGREPAQDEDNCPASVVLLLEARRSGATRSAAYVTQVRNECGPTPSSFPTRLCYDENTPRSPMASRDRRLRVHHERPASDVHSGALRRRHRQSRHVVAQILGAMRLRDGKVLVPISTTTPSRRWRTGTREASQAELQRGSLPAS